MHSISDYAYDLPEELIAQTPAPERNLSRLMVLDRRTGEVRHRAFSDILDYLRPRDALVINDTKVIPARLETYRGTGGYVEILLVERLAENRWRALARPASRLKEGESLRLKEGGEALLEAFEGSGFWTLEIRGVSGEEALLRMGRMPLPLYIGRQKISDPLDELDRERYQTVYGAHPGAIAAPTAGLHFTAALLDEIRRMGVRVVNLTLHVGIGTFAPVREEDITRHRMHEERFEITAESADQLNETRREGGRVIAVGTTSARVLETVASREGTVSPASGRTDLFIYPPYRFNAVDMMLTNFHLPKSTLLMLVSAFAGRDKVLAAYGEAVKESYRFYSYGDAMLLCEGPG